MPEFIPRHPQAPVAVTFTAGELAEIGNFLIEARKVVNRRWFRPIVRLCDNRISTQNRIVSMIDERLHLIDTARDMEALK